MSSADASPAELWKVLAAGLETEHVPLLQTLTLRALELIPIAPAARVLNVEAGTGTAALLLAPRAAHVVCTEDWPSDYERASRRLQRERAENVVLMQASLEALPFQGKEFDAVWWVLPLWIIAEKAQGLREVHRVLTAQGRLTVVLWDHPRRMQESHEQPTWFVDQLASVGFGPVVVHEERFNLSAPSEVAVMIASEATAIARASPSRARYMRLHLAAMASEVAQQTLGPVDLLLTAFIIDACRAQS